MRSTRCRSARTGRPAAKRRTPRVATEIPRLTAVSEVIVTAGQPSLPEFLSQLSTGLGTGVQFNVVQAILACPHVPAATGANIQIVARPVAVAGLDVVPVWQAKARRLYFDGVLIKWLRQPAKNQDDVLAAFQAAGWRSHIEDPFPDNGVDPYERLYNTVRRLNDQIEARIKFSCDGYGTGICWAPR